LAWAGRLGEDAFLSRIFDLTSLPSHDHRATDAAGDIYIHRVKWNDGEDDWVLSDSRFNLLHGPDEILLRFLCETVHPVVRPNTEAALEMVNAYNKELAADNWQLVEIKKTSDRPVFGPQMKGQQLRVSDEPTGWQRVDRQLQEIKLGLSTAKSEENFQSVGLLCREALISVAQEIFDPELHKPSDGILPSRTDAKRMLEAFFAFELQGGVYAEARSHAKAALVLAVALQHNRSADWRTASICAEATFSVVNLVAILANKRGRSI
jgi:hypothetical protein